MQLNQNPNRCPPKRTDQFDDPVVAYQSVFFAKVFIDTARNYFRGNFKFSRANKMTCRARSNFENQLIKTRPH